MKSLHLQIDECPDAMGNAILRLHDGTPNGDTESQPVATVYGDHAERIAACVNACHGLSLPDDVKPGALAELIAAAREVAPTGPPNSQRFFRLDAALANLGPVSPQPSKADQIRAEYSASDDPDAVLRRYKLDDIRDLDGMEDYKVQMHWEKGNLAPVSGPQMVLVPLEFLESIETHVGHAAKYTEAAADQHEKLEAIIRAAKQGNPVPVSSWSGDGNPQNIAKTQPRTIREWLETLPPGYRELALKNLGQSAVGDLRRESIYVSLSSAFVWKKTPEGDKFWRLVSGHYRSPSNPLPQLPTT